MLTKSYQSKHYPQYSPVYIRVDRLKSDEIFLVASKLQINNRISFVYTTLKTKCTPWPLGHWDLAIRENIPPTQTIFCIQNEAILPIRGEKNPFCFFFSFGSFSSERHNTNLGPQHFLWLNSQLGLQPPRPLSNH